MLERLHGVHHLLGVLEHFQAFRCQAHTARVAQEQLHPKLAFEHGDAAGNRRLGGEELVGGEAETLEPGDPDEGFEKLQVHVIKFFLWLGRVFISWTQRAGASKNRHIRFPR